MAHKSVWLTESGAKALAYLQELPGGFNFSRWLRDMLVALAKERGWRELKMRHEASVIEDNGGGLTLYVFGRGGIDKGKVIYSHSGYEHNPGQLSQDLQALVNGDDPRSWDGCDDDPQGNYDQITSWEHGWESVAQVHGGKLHTFPRRMGAAARIEFSVEED